MAYARVDLVTKRGEFAVRGGILDVFPPTDEHPSRVEFWGDEVEEIRTFAVADQRTIEQVDRCSGRRRAGSCCSPRRSATGPPRSAEQHPELAEILDKLAEGIPVEGMESLAPGCWSAPTRWSCCWTACRPAPTCCSATRSGSAPGRTTWSVPPRSSCRPAGPRPRSAARPRSTSAPPRSRPWPRYAPPPASSASRGGRCRRSGWSRRRGRARPRQPWEDAPAAVAVTPDDAIAVTLSAQPAPLYHGETARVVDDLKRWAGEGWSIALVFEGHGPAQRAVEVLRDAGLGARLTEEVPTAPRPRRAGGHLRRAQRTGSSTRRPGSSLLTGNDVTGGRGASTRDMRKMPSRRRNTIDPLELKAGDHVVHEQHGIGTTAPGGVLGAQVVDLVERALALLHERYSDEPTLLERFGEAAADDVRLAIENAREGFDRFVDHYRDFHVSRSPSPVTRREPG